MTYFDSLEFVYRLILARFDFVVWGWSLMAVTISLTFLYWLWGLAWNTQWGFFGHPGPAIFNTLLALVIGGSAVVWLAADRSGHWLEQQRKQLPSHYADNGARNRRILVAAAGQLGQPQAASANTMTLRDARDFDTLVGVAASSVSCPLLPSGPLGIGAPCRTPDPLSAVQTVTDTVPPPVFPYTVSPDNPWVRAALSAQVEGALSYAMPLLTNGMSELKALAAGFFGIAVVLQLITIPVAAVRDIQVNPKVDRA